jgi:hypothetical protein
MIDHSNVAGGGNTWRPMTMAAARRASRNSIAGSGSEAAHHKAIWATVAITPAAIPASTALRQWMLGISCFNGLGRIPAADVLSAMVDLQNTPIDERI